jgi:hypothetical protein
MNPLMVTARHGGASPPWVPTAERRNASALPPGRLLWNQCDVAALANDIGMGTFSPGTRPP